MSKTLVLIKPDGVQRGLCGVIIERFERRGLKIVGMKLMHMDQALARRHYAVHDGKPFFKGLVDYITSTPIVAMVLEGKDAVEVVRRTMGETNPAKAPLGTIRGDFALEIGRNLVHGSDSDENAAKEIALFFSEKEVLSYNRDYERWITESVPF
ncbi:MAG: nucleoside-diphosphate kinase [Dehalococcoidia bacterium]|nr:nucleoside-diphosphate kinase [Dehalococcoidia bacterium]